MFKFLLKKKVYNIMSLVEICFQGMLGESINIMVYIPIIFRNLFKILYNAIKVGKSVQYIRTSKDSKKTLTLIFQTRIILKFIFFF